MAGHTLVRTTLTGVRPLGVRGEPLHHAQAQIRTVVRRRLGERHFHLLAEPQPHQGGGRIDWYSERSGAVRALAELPETERAIVRSEIDALLADIDRLGQELEGAPSDDARLAGRSLRLAARRPSEDYLFLVDEQPVVVCWGYDTQAAGAVLPPTFLAGATTIAAPPPPPPSPPPSVTWPVAPVLTAGPAGAAALLPARFPWLFWLLAGLLAIVIVMLASWLLRQCLPVPPHVQVTRREPPPAPPQPPAADPTIGLQDDIDAARRDAARLRATLASLRDELARRYQQCRPPGPAPADEPRPRVSTEPGGVLTLPDKPTTDYSFLKGCWRGDEFRYTPQFPPGHHTYCFDENGNGTLTYRWQTGVTCEGRATARFEGTTLRIVDHDTKCSHNQPWAQDRLVCRAGAGNVAECSGETSIDTPQGGAGRGTPTPFTVRLHRQ